MDIDGFLHIYLEENPNIDSEYWNAFDKLTNLPYFAKQIPDIIQRDECISLTLLKFRKNAAFIKNKMNEDPSQTIISKFFYFFGQVRSEVYNKRLDSRIFKRLKDIIPANTDLFCPIFIKNKLEKDAFWTIKSKIDTYKDMSTRQKYSRNDYSKPLNLIRSPDSLQIELLNDDLKKNQSAVIKKDDIIIYVKEILTICGPLLITEIKEFICFKLHIPTFLFPDENFSLNEYEPHHNEILSQDVFDFKYNDLDKSIDASDIKCAQNIIDKIDELIESSPTALEKKYRLWRYFLYIFSEACPKDSVYISKELENVENVHSYGHSTISKESKLFGDYFINNSKFNGQDYHFTDLTDSFITLLEEDYPTPKEK